jgi:predicted NAD-dependent protein-ADP-ribosyltransferase YbiA (DUF1768 family)
MVKWRLEEENVAFDKHPKWTTFRDDRMKARARIQRMAAEKKNGGRATKRRRRTGWNSLEAEAAVAGTTDDAATDSGSANV